MRLQRQHRPETAARARISASRADRVKVGMPMHCPQRLFVCFRGSYWEVDPAATVNVVAYDTIVSTVTVTTRCLCLSPFPRENLD